LSCNGTSKLTGAAAAPKPDPITNVGIIVNVADRTVALLDYITPVTGISATLVSFSGRQKPVRHIRCQLCRIGETRIGQEIRFESPRASHGLIGTAQRYRCSSRA